MASPSPAPSNSSSAYDTTHRAFLQSFLSHSTLTLTTARPILAAILTAASSNDDHPRTTLANDITEAEFTSYINSLNVALSPYDFEIRSAIPQTGCSNTQTQTNGERNGDRRSAGAGAENERIYALINTTSDPQTQLATTYTPAEIAYIKRLLDAMFETYNVQSGREICAVTEMQAAQLSRVSGSSSRRSMGSSTQQQRTNGDDEDGDGNDTATQQTQQTQSLTLPQATTVLKTLVHTGWLMHPTSIPGAKNYYVLSPRALLELKNWLFETYNEPPEEGEEEDEGVERIKTCKGCSEIVISGQRCADKGCGVRMHDFCVGAVMRASGAGRGAGGGERKCPECGKGWTGREFVGVRAVKEVGERWLARQGGGAERRVNGRGREDEEEEEEEE